MCVVLDDVLIADFDDFNPCFFPPDWCRCYDRIGDGCSLFVCTVKFAASCTKDENCVLAPVEFCNHHTNSCALPSIRMARSNSTCRM